MVGVMTGAGGGGISLEEAVARRALLDTALAAWGAGDGVGAETAALGYLGFVPPQRASGDVTRALAADPRYRRLGREVVWARARALTGGVVTKAPACCAAVTARVTEDPTGFRAILAPESPVDGEGRADAWLLSPLDPTLGFVPCGHGCLAAQAARRASLAGRDLSSLRGLLAVRLLRLAPGVDLIVGGASLGEGRGVRLERLFLLLAASTPPVLAQLVEALVVRRLIAGRAVRLRGEALESKQGLVFVKMLHCASARWLDLT